MKDALVAAVVHDLKNALASLTGSAEDIARRAAGTDLECDARALHVATASLTQRMVGFLTLYRSGQAGLSAKLRDHTPADFLREFAAGLVLQSPVEVRIADDDTTPFWYFDDYLTRMALEAAVQNALRFARNTVVLSSGTRDGYLVFSVADDGPGLGQDESGEPSTGLGTALCEAIARAHTDGARTGRVVLRNRPGGGCVFEFWVP